MGDDTLPWESPDVTPLTDPNAAPPMADPTPATPKDTSTDDSIWAWLGFHKASAATIAEQGNPNATVESVKATEDATSEVPDIVAHPVKLVAPKVKKALTDAGVPDPSAWWDQNKVYFIAGGIGVGVLVLLVVVGYSARGIAGLAHEVRS